ncbi:MAG: hypothetical protein ACD_23C00750G0006 [uncultured bacterium]|nr:MAG: hypothetical protein ACD_23C00750G0006 [uncultured bacterium]
MKTSNPSLQTSLAEAFPFALQATSKPNGTPAVGFLHGGIVIHDPTVTECGRFAVPPAHYGMTDAQVLALVRLNATIDEAAQAAINARAYAIQECLGITTGDEAGHFFTGENQEQIEAVFLRYALNEVAMIQEKK